MGKLTFVIDFEDGKEPPVHAHMKAFGGKVVAVAFRDALSEQEEREQVASTYEPLNTIRCFICNGRHPIGVSCPLNTITSVVQNG
ncbi:hypothetical protein [Citrobacter sp. FDAARGOS_156]|uniref:hypothetical protein n=1 Tax=Citrobacter TaxID=544 RepID=UPI0018FF6207|nr:hypothetical protein [Citrobacter sp. FDAARGOS_156]MBJ8923400.1 hypothetical protein [Citrobacter sp. FDAARGOS_156]HEE0054759.1 hypothetical protein [Citrobacter freundii]